MSYEVLSREKKFHGKIVDVVEEHIETPDGKEIVREIVLRGEASAVLPVDADGKIIFVRQYRAPIGGLALEIPAGMIDEGESPLDCAVRELEEEAGVIAGKISRVAKMHTGIGYSTEVNYIFIAEDLREGTQHFDDDEYVEVEKYSLNEAIEMIYDGRITDGKTIAAVLAYFQKNHKG